MTKVTSVKTKIPVRRASSQSVFVLPIQIEHRSPVQVIDVERAADETIQMLVEKLAETQQLVARIHDELGGIEWSTPEHAEEILCELIDKYYPETLITRQVKRCAR